MLQGHHQVHLGFQFEVGRDDYAQSNMASAAFDFCVAGQRALLPAWRQGQDFRLQIFYWAMRTISTIWRIIFLLKRLFRRSPQASKSTGHSI